MKIEMLAIEQIKEYDRNPRQCPDEAVTRLAAGIQEFGFKVPVIVDPANVLIAGHTRLRAARSLGLKTVPAIRADDLSEEQIRAFRISDNKLHELTSWDDLLLVGEVTALNDADFNLELLAFDDAEIDRLLKTPIGEALTDPDAVPEPPKVAVTQPGDLVLLGEHRLLCGDSTAPDDVGRLMHGERAILFSTDPPYLVGYDGNNHPHKWNEANKNKDWSDTYSVTWDDADANPELFDKFVAVAVAEAIDPHAAWYCWHASRRQAMLEAVWEKHGAFVHQQIIWNKDRPILTRSWYMWQHEPCFMGWVKGNKPPRIADDNPRSVWNLDTIAPGTQTDHPTSKPVELFAIPMRQHTKPGEVCYEPFSGSGSQLIAAQQEGRRCFAMEIIPIYCDVAVARWEAFTGQKATRHSGTAAPEKTPAKVARVKKGGKK